MRSSYAIILVSGLLFASCSQKLTLQKRKYNKGFHIAVTGGKSSGKQQLPARTIQQGEAENIPVKEVLPNVNPTVVSQKPEPVISKAIPVTDAPPHLKASAEKESSEAAAAAADKNATAEIQRHQNKSNVITKRKDIFGFIESVGRGIAVIYFLLMIFAVGYAIFVLVPYPLSLLYIAGLIVVILLLAAIGSAV